MSRRAIQSFEILVRIAKYQLGHMPMKQINWIRRSSKGQPLRFTVSRTADRATKYSFHMGFKMLALSDKWGLVLVSKPETGMGYQIVTVKLRDGREFNQVVIESGFVTKVRGYKDVPFKEEEIADITVTHDKWDFKAES